MSDGIVKHRGAFSQQLLFEGVEYKTDTGNCITPTDIDAVLEFRNKLFVFIEVKRRTLEISGGQLWAFERICRALHDPPTRICTYFKCWHDVETSKPVRLVDLRVQSVYWKFRKAFKWRDHPTKPLVIEAVNNLLDIAEILPSEVSRCNVSQHASQRIIL